MAVTAAGVIISEQTYGETVDAGQVAYLKSDGKWYLARADSTTTSAGDLAIALDSGVAGGKGRLVKLGYVNNPAWSWTPGAPVYLSAATAGALTQTRPTGAGTVVRIVGYPASATVLWVDPADPLTLATVEGLTATKGDLIGGEDGAWSNISVSTDPWACLHPNPSKSTGLEWMPPVPALQNRVLRIKDGADTPNDLEIHQVWIPFFRSAGFSQPNLNDLLLGGFWVDKYQACQPLATATSRGGLTPNSPGAGVGAACKPHVVPWTDVSWNTARAALENRGGTANKSAGGTPTACAMYASGDHPKSEFLVASADHLIGRLVEITQGGVTHYRRIIKQGISDEAKYVRIYPDLPATITTSDKYTIIGHHMITPYEWFSLAAWAMTFRYRHGLGYPAGNNDWGKDIGDPRAVEYEGLTDPVRGGYDNHEKSRCLTGSGPLSWSLNGREDGVWDLNGNVWEWVFQQVVTDGTNMSIAQGYPGAGTIVTPPGTSGQRITAMYDADAPVDGLSLNPDICLPTGMSSSGSAEFGNDGCWWKLDAATYAALRGGIWYYGLDDGVWAVLLNDVPTGTGSNIGFRGAF